MTDSRWSWSSRLQASAGRRASAPVLGLGAEAGVLEAHDLQRGTAVVETVDGEIT
jgi:hypothetical protein